VKRLGLGRLDDEQAGKGEELLVELRGALVLWTAEEEERGMPPLNDD